MNYFIQTFGCQMNKSDSEHLKGVLEGMNMSECDKPEQADVIILNTCSIRQSAENRVFGLMKNFGELKKKKPDLILGITGCMVGHDKKQQLWEKLPMVDLYFPISEIESLPKKITELRFNTVSDKTIAESPIAYLESPAKYSSPFEAYIPIMSGCDKFCTFCIVPYSRGRERSRNAGNVLTEIAKLRDQDYKFITLVGQNVNSYRPDDDQTFRSKNNPYKDHFAALLWEINRIGIPWVHFTSPHPRDMTDEVIDALNLPCMINFLHLPVQSGDSQVLRRMNRGYTSEDFLHLVEKIKKKKPDTAIGTDIIVGFPGETDKEFQNTVKLYKEVDFDISYTAIYSPRYNTPAARMKDQVEHDIKKERWNILQQLMEEIVEKKNKKFKDQTVEVIVREKKKNMIIGETRELKKITLQDNLPIGSLQKVKVQESSTWMLYAKRNQTVKGKQPEAFKSISQSVLSAA